MTKPKVFIVDRFHPDVLLLAKAHPDINFEVFPGWELAGASRDIVKGLIIRSRTQIQEKWLGQFPNLKVIQTATSGFDHVDLDLCASRGISVAHTPKAPVGAVAELTFLLMLSALRKQKQVFEQLKKGNWDRKPLLGSQLRHRVLGLVGCGRIGSQVAKLAQGWGMKVVTFDPYLENPPGGVSLLGYEELLRCADILSFHVPKTTKTRHMLNSSTLEMVSSEALIVNTSRGSVINEGDLIGFLKENPKSFGALDVFESEPLPRDSPLYSLPNVILSPHIGASTEESLYDSSLQAMENVVAFFAEGQLEDKLPPPSLWWQDVGQS